MRLNGWQRLFVVFSGIYVVAISYSVVADWPTAQPRLSATERNIPPADLFESRIKAGQSVAMAGLDIAWVYGLPPELSREDSLKLAAGHVTPLMAEYIEWRRYHDYFVKLGGVWTHVRDSAEAANIRQLRWQRTVALGIWAMAVVVPLMLVYMAGWIVAWIIVGFRSPPTVPPSGADPR